MLDLDRRFADSHRILGLALTGAGRYENAVACFETAIENTEEPTNALGGLGYVYTRMGRLDDARSVLDRLLERATSQYVSPVAMAMITIGLGETDRAFEWLEKVYQDRRGWLSYLRVDPLFDALHGDPRHDALCDKMKLRP